MNIIVLLSELQKEPKHLSKQNILKTFADRSFIEYAQLVVGKNPVPKPNYYVSMESLGLSDDFPDFIEYDLDAVIQILRDLESRGKIPTKNELNQIREQVNGLSQASRYLLALGLKQRLDCGISFQTLSKVFPKDFNSGMIQYQPMLASPLKNPKDLKFGCLGQPKYDGSRMMVYYEPGGITQGPQIMFYTRNGKPYLFNGQDIVYRQVCELLVDCRCRVILDGELTNDKNRQSVNGLATKLVKGTIKPEEKDSLIYTIWDIIELENPDLELITRLKKLQSLYKGLSNIRLSPYKEISSLEEAQEYSDTLDRELYDGIILKDPMSRYEFNKRSKKWIKLKDEEECDLLVIGVQEGKGKYKGMIGALIVQDASQEMTVSIGSGMTEEDRRKSPSEYIGKIVSVKYNKIIENKDRNGKPVLFLPIFQELRFDKDTPDTIKL